MSNVVSFMRDGEYLLRRAGINRKDGRLLEALKLTRRAVEVEPDNVEGWMGMAQTLCEMGCHEQSNRVLSLMLSVPGAPTDCYFGMGCNFLGMSNAQAAFGAMMNLIALDPESLSRQDVVGVLSDIIQLHVDGHFEERENKRLERMCSRAESLMRKGMCKVALPLAEKAYDMDSENDQAARVYALALMAAGNAEKALSVIDIALKRQDAGLSTVLAGVKLYNHVGNSQKAGAIAKALICREGASGRELLICLDAACEIKADEAVAALVTKALRNSPFDTRLIHICAVNRLRLGRPIEQAASFWTRDISIDPDDVIARYYLRAMDEGHMPRELSYAYELPQSELKRFDELLRRSQLDSKTQLDEGFSKPGDMREMCLWAMRSSRERTLLAIELLSRSDDPWAKRKLSEAQAYTYEESFNSTKHCQLTQISTYGYGVGYKIMPPRLDRAIKLAFDAVIKPYGIKNIVYLYKAMVPVANERNLPYFGDIRAWAAVLAYVALDSMKKNAPIEQVASLLGCAPRRAERCLRAYNACGGDK